MSSLLRLNMQKSGLVDTMWDIIVDMGGALTVSIAGYCYMKTGMRSFVEEWIIKFITNNPRLFHESNA